MGFAGSYFEPVSIFWLTAVLTVPALLTLFLVGTDSAAKFAASGAGSGEPVPDDSRITWTGLKGLFLDRRLLTFAVCIVLFFALNAAIMPGVAVRVTRQHPELSTLIVAATILLPQAIVAMTSPWIGRTAEKSGRRPLVLFG
jgi:hypothetical protein